MAAFPPRLMDPHDPESVGHWADQITQLLSGQISIGEPISEDTTRLPNGVKAHMLGSFATRTDIVAPDTMYLFTHNLNIPNKDAGGVNVGWYMARMIHDGTGVGATSFFTYNYDTRDVANITANAMPLRFYWQNRTTIAHLITVTMWFFPTTR